VLCLCIKKLEENIVLIQHKVTQKQGEKNKYKGLEARPPSKIRKQKKNRDCYGCSWEPPAPLKRNQVSSDHLLKTEHRSLDTAAPPQLSAWVHLEATQAGYVEEDITETV
jgi:hypothetical protein